MKNRLCLKCKQEINPLRLKALPTAKTCVECSTTGAKRGISMIFGEKDHTWNDMVIMESDEFDKFEKLSSQKPSFDDTDNTDEEDNGKDWDNTLSDGLEDL